jgi:hypothetical protein
VKERPLSVTVVCWILIGLNAFLCWSLIEAIFMFSHWDVIRLIMAQSPIPIRIQFMIGFVGIAATIFSAIAMLYGPNWGRWLYVISNIIGTAISPMTCPYKLMLIPGFLIFVLITVFLFRPAADKYFSTSEGADGPQGV